MGRIGCLCGHALHVGSFPNDVELWVYTHHEWQNIMNSFTDPRASFSIIDMDYQVFRCEECKRLLIKKRSDKTDSFSSWKEILQEQPELLEQDNFTCKCSKLQSQKSIPPEYQLQVYTDWDAEGLLDDSIQTSQDVPPSKYNVWACPDCRRICAFHKGEKKPFATYDFEE